MRYLLESESETIKKASNGDTETFGQLVNHYSNAVNATAYQIVKDFYRSDKFGSWLHTTAKRISLDYPRKDNKFRLKTMDDLKFASQVETTEDIVIRNERQTSYGMPSTF